MTRLIIGVFIAIVGIGIIGAIIYYGWGAVTKFILPGEETPAAAPPASPAKPLSDGAVLDYWINQTGQEVLGIAPDGKILSLKSDADQTISNQIINGLNRILPSPDGQQAIVAFGNPRRPQFSLYNVSDRAWRPLPLEILNLVWTEAPDNLADIMALIERGAFVALESIKLTAGDLNKVTAIKDLALEDFELDWITPNALRFTDKPSASYAGSVWSLNLLNNELAQILPPESGLMVKWHKGNLWGLKFSSPNSLSVVDNRGAVLQKLPFTTLPSKCALEENVIYCFIPKSVDFGWQLPDDYIQKAFYSRDDLYKINLKDGKAEVLFESAPLNIDGFNPKLFNNQILFINRYDQKLYSFALP